jgi:non-specific serine/threonine protein kinase
VRLLTLIGPGGVGKTRLAIRIAEETEAFPGGVWFVRLAQVRDAGLVAPAIGPVLGIRYAPEQTAEGALIAFLRARRALLVLDNVEHVLEAGPLFVRLLRACPSLTILVTSRSVLSVSGEYLYPVPPLTMPPPGMLPPPERLDEFAAIQLFIERAAAVGSGFALDDVNASAVVELCRRLDGLPLAIELAAARVNVFPPALLLGRMEDRLSLLTAGPRDQPSRLRTLRDSIAWSDELLAPEERCLFRRLAVFARGFTLEAAEAVAVAAVDGERPAGLDVLGGITTLVHASLLKQIADTGGDVRFLMLETIREYARERLLASGEEQLFRAAHAAWYARFAEEAEAHLLRKVEAPWLDRLAAEEDNLRLALAWSLGEGGDPPGAPELGMRLAGALWLYWYYRSHLAEGRRWLERAIDVAASGVSLTWAKVLVGLGTLAHAQGDEARALDLLTEGIGLLRRLGADWWTAFALSVRGNLAEDAGHFDEAEAYFGESNALFAGANDEVNVAITLYHLGVVAFGMGDLDRSEQRCADALGISRRAHDPWGAASALGCLGLVQSARGAVEPALAHLREALGLFLEIGSIERIADLLRGVAVVASVGGDRPSAARLFAAADALQERIGAVQSLPERATYDSAQAALRAAIDPGQLAAATAAGREMTVDEAIALAHALVLEQPSPVIPAEAELLSPREREVLRLLSEGKTDAQIADALSVSRRTASTHVQHIFNKLGVSSRAAAAVYALRHGLV